MKFWCLRVLECCYVNIGCCLFLCDFGVAVLLYWFIGCLFLDCAGFLLVLFSLDFGLILNVCFVVVMFAVVSLFPFVIWFV